jgi:hypothetical protein
MAGNMSQMAEEAREADEAEATADDERPSAVLWVLLGFGVLRIAAVVGQRPIIWGDSPNYEIVDFTGRYKRPWVAPLLFHLVHDPAGRVLVQAAISAVCWGLLALEVAFVARDVRVRWGLMLGILGLGLTTAVTSWDATILSESLAVSFTALLLAALLRWRAEPGYRSVGFVLAAWVLWTWTRQAHLFLAILGVVALAAILLWPAVRSRSLRGDAVRRSSLALLLGVAGITSVAAWTYSRNTEVLHVNLNQVFDDRFLNDEGRIDWMVDHGMPKPGDDAARARIRRWLEEDGVGVYARYLLTHPWDTLTDPLEALVSDRPPWGDDDRADEVMLAGSERYGVAREVLPGPVEDLLFHPGEAGNVLLALALAVGGTLWAWRRDGADGRWAVPLVVLGLQVPALILVWHSSATELGRLAMPSALLVRMVLILQLGLLVERGLAGRARREGSALAPPDGGPVDLVDG